MEMPAGKDKACGALTLEKEHRGLRNTINRRNGLLLGRLANFVIQGQVVSSEFINLQVTGYRLRGCIHVVKSTHTHTNNYT